MTVSASAAKKNATQPRAEAALVREVIEPQTRRELIAQAAYFRAQHRGFASGHEQEDWYAAEMEVDNAIGAGDKGWRPMSAV